MLNLLIMVIAFGLMILIHELGHFLCARAFGVGIEKLLHWFWQSNCGV